jgi:hypothetical protein
MGCSPATPAAEGVPHGGMGGARTDGGHPMTGPILKKAQSSSRKKDALYNTSRTSKASSYLPKGGLI